MNISLAAAAAAVLLSAQSAVAQAPAAPRPQSPGWTRQSYPSDLFEVEFSGEVKVDVAIASDKTKSGAGVIRRYSQIDGNKRFLVIVSGLQSSKAFEASYKSGVAALKCQAPVLDMPLLINEGVTREIAAGDCLDHLQVLVRYYGVGKMFYQVLALYKDDAELDDARHFVRSFRPTGR